MKMYMWFWDYPPIIFFYQLFPHFDLVFSSPEHNVLGVSCCDCPLSRVHSNDISAVTIGWTLTKVDRIVP